MASEYVSGIKRFLLWDYSRATWQYDVMVALILVFIFTTPRDLFHDQPKVSNIVRLPAEGGADLFWVDSELLDNVAADKLVAKVEQELKSRFGRQEKVLRLERVPTEHEVKGYLAFTKP
ncbi:MAG: hypothetical protein H7039_02555 [Bryobacteraceae bacterium]|nr:hypothetical protein [Bryobacteraceae bacterium]